MKGRKLVNGFVVALFVFTLAPSLIAQEDAPPTPTPAPNPAPAPAPDAQEPPPQVQPPPQPQQEFPYIGKVSGENVNIRSKPSSDNNTSRIIVTVTKGEEVTVVGEESGFLKIVAPPGTPCWVSGRLVKKTSESEGEVTGEDVHIRSDATAGSEPIGTLAKGAVVKIMGEKMGWLKVEAPNSVRYYISKKFVEKVGPADVALIPPEQKPDVKPNGKPTDQTPVKPPVATKGDPEAAKQLQEAKRLVKVEAAKMTKGGDALLTADFRVAEGLLQNIINTTKDEAVRKEAGDELARAKALAIIVEESGRFVGTVKKTEGEIDKLRNPVRKIYDAEGWVEGVGPLLHDRPGSHELKDGGRRVCFLSTEGRKDLEDLLNRYFKARVGVRGRVIDNPPGWSGERQIIVEQVELIAQ